MANLHMNFRSDVLRRSVYPVVFLPDMNMWRDIEPPYPVLIFMNGYSGGATETAMFTNIALYAMRYGVAVVMADGDNSFYADDEEREAMYSRFFGEELPDAVRSVVPLSDKREENWIAGISMGGYGALINGLRYSDRYSKIGMLSPALGFKRQDDSPSPDSPVPEGELMQALGTWEKYQGSYKDYDAVLTRAAEEGRAIPEMFLGVGREDGLYKEALKFRKACEQRGQAISWFERDGGHDHVFWKNAMDPLFHFLTGKDGV